MKSRTLFAIVVASSFASLAHSQLHPSYISSPTKPKHGKGHGGDVHIDLLKNASPLTAGGYSASQDFGDVAVVADDGLMVTEKNIPDLNGTQVRFDPAGPSSFSISHSAAAIDPSLGTPLIFGYPGTIFPGDDDTQEIQFPAGFPYFGTTYHSVWVNTDGNVTFGAPEIGSDDRDKLKHVSGPPRISAWLADWSPLNALNPAGQGTINAVAKTGPDRLVITWSGVMEYTYGGTSTFQIILYSSGSIEIRIANIAPTITYGTVGVASGNAQGPYRNTDLSQTQASVAGGAVFESFAQYTSVSDIAVAREFYANHPDKYDFLNVFTDFTTNDFIHSHWVSSQDHGIGLPMDPANGQPVFQQGYDTTSSHGSAGELEQMVMLNNIYYWPGADRLVNPPVQAYHDGANIIDMPERFGWRTTPDGQTIPQYRVFGTLPPDDGEMTRFYPHGGAFSNWIMSPMAIVAQEVEHRWGADLKFVHPTKGIGFDSYDLLGRDIQHWSYFANTASLPGQFAAPSFTGMEGNFIQDLGQLSNYIGAATNLNPGEEVFKIPEGELCDGYCPLDLYIMGLSRSSEVGPFWYVDDPASIYTNQSLDVFNPSNPLDTSYTMRGWAARGGVVFKGKRVNLTVQDIMNYEKYREGNDNPQGKRFWGPKGNLKVRYFANTGHVDPNGDSVVTLSESDRALGDEADQIDSKGKPVDVKTMAFILVVKDGSPGGHAEAVSRVDAFRQVWQGYANGPATAGKGRFDTSLNPFIY